MGSASSAIHPWYRHRWPWLLMAAPAASIVLGGVLWTLAARSDDGLVAKDYYRRGLAINQKVRAVANDVPRVTAVLRVSDAGEVRVRVEGADAAGMPPTVRLTLSHSGRAARTIVLARDAADEYAGVLGEQGEGRVVVTLESSSWRLPTTTTVGRLSMLRLGTAAPHGGDGRGP